MPGLQGVIISFRDTLVQNGKLDKKTFSEVEKLVRFLQLRRIQFAVLANENWYVTNDDGERFHLVDRLRQRWGHFEYFCRALDRKVPRKPGPGATKHVIENMGWQPSRVVYIGASDNDAITASAGDILFLRATWFSKNTDYGLPFASPFDICRFIDTFCLRQHWWFMRIEDGPFRYYSLAPFSTFKEAHKLYSEDARAAAKHGAGHPDFWLAGLVTSVYFTGLHREMNYIAVVPGHQAGYGNKIMEEMLDLFGKCFRAKYIPDLVLRHTTATKLQHARQQKKQISHTDQLNTIRLEKLPIKKPGERYKSPPLSSTKTVLLVDDFCTRGYSMESARAFLEQTGAKVIMVTWLKTINSDIERLGPVKKFDPYVINKFDDIVVDKTYNYQFFISDQMASKEIDKLFRNYEDWSWPKEVNQGCK